MTDENIDKLIINIVATQNSKCQLKVDLFLITINGFSYNINSKHKFTPKWSF